MIKQIILFLYRNVYGYRNQKLLNVLKKQDIFDIEANGLYQRRKLFKVIEEAVSEIDFYKSLNLSFKETEFSYKEFQGIPIMTKDTIRLYRDKLINPCYIKKGEVFRNTSGGSTGEPVEFFRTKDQSRFGNANYQFALHLNNVNLYDTAVDLWGAERDMYNPRGKFGIKTFIHNKYTLNTFVLSESIIHDYISVLNRIKPKFIKAYVHSVYDIAKFINSREIAINFKPTIHCTTGPLYPEMRVEIEKAFNQARVYNFYGSREVSAIASEVYGSDGLYVLYDNVFVEILDDHDRPVEVGEEGQIVITTLNNFYMPLIRYKIGDRAIKGDNLTFGTLKLSSVLGRTLGVIHRKDGIKIDGQFFTTLFFNTKGIRNFQLIQRSLSSLVLKVVKTADFDRLELDQILDRIKKEVPDTTIEIEFCEAINLTSTGKIMYVYSDLDQV